MNQWISRRTLAILIIVALLGLLVFAYTVWPTPYRYGEIRQGQIVLPIRTHRLTNETEIYYQGWHRRKEPKPLPRGRTLFDSEVDKVTGTAEVRYDSELKLQVYNGSAWTLASITISVTCEDKSVVERKFKKPVELPPLSTGSFVVDLGFKPTGTWSFQIVDAEGTPPD